ncbi:hypothetical protein [Aureimonas sp. N4]|uniref:hypothetical protein n=1 Tax=Aureimonas sp. N4 TaxID=1638165 RepID=UPI00078469FB|nr:hypothetical protein [Aureimonas sp. N4]
MSSTSPTPPTEVPLSGEQKLTAKRFNERVKLVVAILHSVALAIFGLGGLRLAFDPTVQPPAMAAIILAIVIPMVLEGIAFYILGKLKAEN